MTRLSNSYPKQNWIVNAFRKYSKKIVGPGEVQHAKNAWKWKCATWNRKSLNCKMKSEALKDRNMMWVQREKSPRESAFWKEYNKRKVLGRKDATWNECDMEECNVKSSQWEKKQQRKRAHEKSKTRNKSKVSVQTEKIST